MEKVMVAMSGGVDSSVALLLLKDKYELIGATLRLYNNEDVGDKSGTCCSLSDVEDARLVASKFGIKHYVYNFGDLFKTEVIDRFTGCYIAGGTPNPCIDCNRYVKFGAMLERARSLDCGYIATGHYARVEFDGEKNRWLLKKAVCESGDNNKDQSYVLYDLTQEQLAHILFPLGSVTKTEVREIAEENGLVNSHKPDSQDICFVPDGDYARFITEYAGYRPEPGDVITSSGEKVGTHTGTIGYTIGQRKGLGIAFGTPMYVVGKDAALNTVTVGTNEELFRTGLDACDLNWISIPELTAELRCKAKTRYKQPEQPCTVRPSAPGEVHVEFDEPQRAITKGQRVVFYDGDVVIGGGVIK